MEEQRVGFPFDSDVAQNYSARPYHACQGEALIPPAQLLDK